MAGWITVVTGAWSERFEIAREAAFHFHEFGEHDTFHLLGLWLSKISQNLHLYDAGQIFLNVNLILRK